MKKVGIDMVYTSKTQIPEKEKEFIYLFLAGSIQKGKDNWRKKLIDHVEGKIHFFDPTYKKQVELNNIQMQSHIEWELDALQIADKIILNFLPDSTSPISLVELGLYVSSNKLIVVCPKEFYKSRYINILCNKYSTPLYSNINEALKNL